MVRRTHSEAMQTRKSIIDAAEKLFVRDGFLDASLSAIVSEAGITKGALFHYFPSKEAVFREVWTRLQDQMNEEAKIAAREAASETDPYASFLAGCRVYLEWTSRPDYQKILVVEGPAVRGMLELYFSENEAGARNMRRGLTYISKQGVFPADLIEPYGLLLLNALNGAGFAVRKDDEKLSVDEVYDAFERLLRGLR